MVVVVIVVVLIDVVVVAVVDVVVEFAVVVVVKLVVDVVVVPDAIVIVQISEVLEDGPEEHVTFHFHTPKPILDAFSVDNALFLTLPLEERRELLRYKLHVYDDLLPTTM